eukprot:2045458-Rhodomonas_salina.7
MSIVYSLISRGVTVFCEYTRFTVFLAQPPAAATAGQNTFLTHAHMSNFVQISRDILEKVEAPDDETPTYNSYTYDDHVFHMVIQKGVYYVAMATKDLERRIAFAFLEDIKVWPSTPPISTSDISFVLCLCAWHTMPGAVQRPTLPVDTVPLCLNLGQVRREVLGDRQHGCGLRNEQDLWQ